MINERAEYTSNTGIATLTAANPNRDGSGTIVSVITGANSGTQIKKIIIKSTGNTTSGMIRLYCYLDASTILLFKEIKVQAVTKSASDHSYYTSLDLNFILASGYQIMASTENAETFIVTAEGLNWTY